MDRSSREGAKTRRARHGSGYSFTTYSSYTSDSAGHDYSIYTEEGAGTVGTYTDHSDGWSSSYFYGVRWDGGVDSDSSYDSSSPTTRVPSTWTAPPMGVSMPEVVINGWNPGLDKIELNHLLRKQAGFSLAFSKNAVDQLLSGQTITVEFPDTESARDFCRAASALGAVVDQRVL